MRLFVDFALLVQPIDEHIGLVLTDRLKSLCDAFQCIDVTFLICQPQQLQQAGDLTLLFWMVFDVKTHGHAQGPAYPGTGVRDPIVELRETFFKIVDQELAGHPLADGVGGRWRVGRVASLRATLYGQRRYRWRCR